MLNGAHLSYSRGRVGIEAARRRRCGDPHSSWYYTDFLETDHRSRVCGIEWGSLYRCTAPASDEGREARTRLSRFGLPGFRFSSCIG